MDLFNYKHNDNSVKRDYEDILLAKKVITDIPLQPPITKNFEKEIESTSKLIDKNEELTNLLKNELVTLELHGVNETFDKTVLDELDKFHAFMRTLMPGIPPYYSLDEDGNAVISFQAYIDAKDFLLNEFGFDEKNIVEEFDYNGNLNLEKFHFANDHSITATGNIYQGKKLILDSNNTKKQIIEYIDFDDRMIKIKPGIFISTDKIAPIEELKDYFINNNDFVETSSKGGRGRIWFNQDKDEMIRKIPVEKDTDDYQRYIEAIHNFDGLTVNDLEDIFKKDLKEKLKNLIRSKKNFPEGFQSCSTTHTNYLWLMFLLIIGGGSAGRAPLPQDHTVCGYYNKPHRNSFGFVGDPAEGKCSELQYRTGHNKTFSTLTQQGIKVSLVQMLYTFLTPFFDLNMNSLNFEFKVSKWKVKLNLMPFFCIGGLIEHSICKLQEWISSEIRKTQGCNSQYIIPKLKKTGEGIMLDGIEELNSKAKNHNDVVIFFRRNFAILWNYTHYIEAEKREEMIKLYSTLKISEKIKLTMEEIQDLSDKNIQLSYTDIRLNTDNGVTDNSLDNSYRLKIQPSSLVRVFSSNVKDGVNTNVDPSNV
uniref:hypothetical protein n=1 Tax=uncultured Cetobacterium sp. TaxID=527638 RepID=UPI0026222C10